MACVEDMIRVRGLVLSGGTSDVDLIHPHQSIHAVVLLPKQGAEHVVHLGAVDAAIEGLSRLLGQIAIPPVGGGGVGRLALHRPVADDLQVGLTGDVDLGSHAIGGLVLVAVADAAGILEQGGAEDTVEVRSAGKEVETVLGVQAVATEGKEDQRTQQPGESVQVLHLIGHGRIQQGLQLGRDNEEGHGHVHHQRNQVVHMLDEHGEPMDRVSQVNLKQSALESTLNCKIYTTYMASCTVGTLESLLSSSHVSKVLD